MYIWTAPGTGTAGFLRASGVSNDRHRAREAAEAALRTGHAATAFVERVYTAVGAPALDLCYVRTGTGWQARLSRAGRVEWKPFTAVSDRHPAEVVHTEAVPAAAPAVMATASAALRTHVAHGDAGL